MKRQQLLTLVILVVVVGGLGLFLMKKEGESWNNTADSRVGKKLLDEFPLNDVAHVRIQGPTNQINVTKKDDIWTVQERGAYPANFTKVRDVVRKLWEMKVTQPQIASTETLPRFQLLPPGQGTNSASVVEFKDKDGKTLANLRLGKKHMRQSSGGFGGDWPDGRYVMVGDDLKTVALVNDALSDIEPDPQQWIDKDFLKVEKIKSIDIAAPEPTNSWSVSRETATGDWRLADPAPGKELDKTKVSPLGNLLSSPYFDDLTLGKEPGDIGLDRPRLATIKTFDEFTYTVRIGDTNSEGNYYMQVDVQAKLPASREPKPDETPEEKEAADTTFKEAQDKLKEKLQKEQRLKNWTYLVSKWTVDPLLKNRSELVTDKQVAADPSEEPSLGDISFPDPTVPLPPSDPPPLPVEKPKAKTKPATPSNPEPEKAVEKPAEPKQVPEPEKQPEPEVPDEPAEDDPE